MTNRIGPVDPNMINKIGNSVDEARGTGKVGTDKGNKDDATGSAATRDDTVNLTNNAQLLERLERSLAATPATDPGRIAEIKAAIESGNYEIDAESIADAMIQIDKALGE